MMEAWNTRLEDRTLGKVVERLLVDQPDAPMLEDANTLLTCSQAYQRALGFARTLDDLGMVRQDRVALLLDNHVENVLCWLGIALSGRIEVSINVAYKGEMLAYLLQDCEAGLLVVERRYLDRVIEIAASVPSLKAILVRDEGPASTDQRLQDGRSPAVLAEGLALSWCKSGAAPHPMKPWDSISIAYTSGTTGRSKGVICPHAHAYGHATSEGVGRTAAGETRFIVLPQFHAAGRWGGVYNSMIRGARAHVADRFRASTFWQDAKSVNARSSQLVGTMAEFLRLQPPSPGDRDHGVKEIGITPLPKDWQSWAERFDVAVTTCYGSTELGSILQSVAPEGNSVGQPRKGYDVRLVDEHDCEVPVGEVGELLVRPDLPWTSSAGYINSPAQTTEAWRNGWLHSGDAFFRDEWDNFHFVDRVDDAIRRRGENISSAEAEYLIAKHAAVREVAVIGVPSEYQEDNVLAVIVREAASPITELQLADDLAQTLPYFMVPRFIRFVDALPKTATEKVQKKLLRDEGTAAAWDAEAAGFVAKR